MRFFPKKLLSETFFFWGGSVQSVVVCSIPARRDSWSVFFARGRWDVSVFSHPRLQRSGLPLCLRISLFSWQYEWGGGGSKCGVDGDRDLVS